MESDILTETTDEESLFPESQSETENSEESSTEPKPTEDAASQEAANAPADEVPPPPQTDFHKDPRWSKAFKEAKRIPELENKLAELEGRLAERQSMQQAPSQIPEWFRGIYGDNQDAWRQYQEYERAKEEAIVQRTLEAQETTQAQEAAEVENWRSVYEDEYQELVGEGKNVDKNELFAYAAKYRPTDEEGNISLRLAYEAMAEQQVLKQKFQTEKSTARKQLASSTTSEPKGESQEEDVMTPSKLRKLGGFRGVGF